MRIDRATLARLHTYAGLLTFVNLMVYAAVGLYAGIGVKPARAIWQVHEQPLQIDAALSDRAVAERVCDALRLSLAKPIQRAVIQHDPEGRLMLDFWHANGRHRVTVLRDEGVIRVEVLRNNFWKFLDTLHTTTAVFRTGDWRMRVWAWENEFAMWVLLSMVVSGAALKFSRMRKASTLHLLSGLFSLPFVLLYGVSAVAIAHRTWFSATALILVHTHAPALGSLIAVGLLALATTGLFLWWKQPGRRKLGTWLLLGGTALTTALIVSMRMG